MTWRPSAQQHNQPPARPTVFTALATMLRAASKARGALLQAQALLALPAAASRLSAPAACSWDCRGYAAGTEPGSAAGGSGSGRTSGAQSAAEDLAAAARDSVRRGLKG